MRVRLRGLERLREEGEVVDGRDVLVHHHVAVMLGRAGEAVRVLVEDRVEHVGREHLRELVVQRDVVGRAVRRELGELALERVERRRGRGRGRRRAARERGQARGRRHGREVAVARGLGLGTCERGVGRLGEREVERELEAECVGAVLNAAEVRGRVRRHLDLGRGRLVVVRAGIGSVGRARGRGAAGSGSLLGAGDAGIVDEDAFPATRGALGARPLEVALDLGGSAGLARLAARAVRVPGDGCQAPEVMSEDKTTYGSPQVRLWRARRSLRVN